MIAWNGAAVWRVLSVALLLGSLDLALRSVKVKLVARAMVREGGKEKSKDGKDAPLVQSWGSFEETDAWFAFVNALQSLHLALGMWPVTTLLKPYYERLPGTIKIVGMPTCTVHMLQGATLLLSNAFLFFMKRDMPWACVVFVGLFNYAQQAILVIANHHRSSKSITYAQFNTAHFYDYVCTRIFELVCLWALWAHWRTDWSWNDSFVLNCMLVAYFAYAIALLLVRIDDTLPQHPSLLASWARVGGPGVASGKSTLGVLRDRMQGLPLVFITLAMRDASLTTPLGITAMLSTGALLLLNHWDLRHKLLVRSITHNNGVTVVNTLAEQDPSLQEDRSANPPPYDVVVTIGCFDLFHEGHVKLMKRMRTFGKRLLVGLHDDESINILKGRFPVDNVVKRMRNVKKYCDQVFVIPSVDPSPYLDAAVDRSVPKNRMCFIRGADMPNFPGRGIAEQLMEVKLTPYTEGVSSTMLRAKLTERNLSSSYRFSDGAMIWFQDSWINTAAEPAGTGWIEYGSDYYRYRTSESSPTIW